MNIELTESQVRKIEQRLQKLQRGAKDNATYNHVRIIKLEMARARRRQERKKATTPKDEKQTTTKL